MRLKTHAARKGKKEEMVCDAIACEYWAKGESHCLTASCFFTAKKMEHFNLYAAHPSVCTDMYKTRLGLLSHTDKVEEILILDGIFGHS